MCGDRRPAALHLHTGRCEAWDQAPARGEKEREGERGKERGKERGRGERGKERNVERG